MSEHDAAARRGVLTLQGKGASPGLACGPLLRNRQDLSPDEAAGGILVAERAVPDDVGRILASAGTLTISGALLSHVSLLSREFGKPSVTLGSGCPARLVPPGCNDALIELLDVVGGSEARPVLCEGDIVLIDGDAGTISIPGGLSEDSRRAIRRAHDALCDAARSPRDTEALATLLGEVEAGGSAAAAYAVEAAALYGAVPAGAATRRILETLLASRTLGESVAGIARDLLHRVEASFRARSERALSSIRLHADLDGLDRAMLDLEEATARDLCRIEDLGGRREAPAGILDAVRAAATDHRQELTARLAADVAAACTLPDGAVRARLGGLLQLVRRARGAGIEGEPVARLETRLTRQVAEERSRHGARLVVALHEDGPADRSLVGGKAAGLFAARAALPGGCLVPRGFVVTTSAYRLQLLGERGERLRDAVREQTEHAALSRRARAILLSGEILDEIAAAVTSAHERLGRARLAVRSSATVEDGPYGSFAGLFDTWLGVGGLEELVHRIRLAWASLWNTRALRAMAATGLSPLEASQAVLVQEIVGTRAAGVLFSRDPEGSPDTLLVNASWGLGEAISQGEIAGDLYWVRRSTGETLVSETGGAKTRIALDPARTGTIEIPLPPERAGRPCLGPQDLGRLAELARALEEATGRALDVEFGIAEDGTILVYQARHVVPRRPA